MTTALHIKCGRIYPGTGEQVLKDQTIVVEGGFVTRVAPSREVPKAPGARELDFSAQFVIPGLIDVHTHLAYGNAKTEEDIDLYSSMEFRTLRGMFLAQQVLAAGFTTIGVPGGSGQLACAVRDAIDSGLFDGPRITAAAQYITSRQGLTDWYPSWIGAPTTSIGRLVTSRDEAIEEIRRQVKDGVDSVKIAMDGHLRRPDGEMVAAFTFDETKAMVDEIHRLGKIAIVHAHGREGTLYSAKSGVDLIFHASEMDDEGLQAVIDNKCVIGPTLTFTRNLLDWLKPEDPAFRERRSGAFQHEFDSAMKVYPKAIKAGVPMVIGTDSGFAASPCGEWHARELEIFVKYLGFTPIQALRSATSVSATVLRPADRGKVGNLAPGCRADLVALDGDPTENICVLLDRSKLRAVIKDGAPISSARRTYDPKRVSDFAMTYFSELYTRERVAELDLQY
jgi:imidazolonepropionase-like amidohydrolase